MKILNSSFCYWSAKSIRSCENESEIVEPLSGVIE